jgi:hypothetical protein
VVAKHRVIGSLLLNITPVSPDRYDTLRFQSVPVFDPLFILKIVPTLGLETKEIFTRPGIVLALGLFKIAVTIALILSAFWSISLKFNPVTPTPTLLLFRLANPDAGVKVFELSNIYGKHVTLIAPGDPVGPVLPVLPVLPVFPVLPVLPVAPVDPILPVAPVFPILPVAPVDPILPVAPVDPILPVAPVFPILPVAPVDPILPVAPVDPILPVAPVDPILPVAPVDPILPVAPVDPILPVAPVDPILPVAPIDPILPVAPENPLDPVGPTEPLCPLFPRLHSAFIGHWLQILQLQDFFELINILIKY